jgi:hypothetical protein
MSTPAQIAANQSNAQHSTGPKTEEGKAASSRNNFRFGLTGSFVVLPWENQHDFDILLTKLQVEHQPQTPFEEELVAKMAQHYWLSQRALLLQQGCFDRELPVCNDEKQLALFLRYQTTHERAFQKCAAELRSLRNQKQKEKIGFESQKRREAEEARRQANETRKQDLHKWRVLLAEAEVDHRVLLNLPLQTPEHRISVGPERILAAPKAA